MKINRFNIFFLLVAFVLISFPKCKKNTSKKNIEIIQTPVETSIRKTTWLNKNIGFFCGGEKGEFGYIYKTTNAGLSWEKVHFESQNSLYDIYFVNDSVGYSCGGDMLILRTNNGGFTWFSIDNKMNSDGSFYGTLHGIYGNEKLLLFVGGTNFNIGIINWVRNGIIQTSWSGFAGFTNEMRCGMLFGSDNYYSFGYGTAYKTTDGKSFNPYPITGDFFTASYSLNATTGFLCSYNGSIYKMDGDGNIKELFGHNRFYKKHINFNGIAFATETQGWAVGNQGVAYQTTDGKTFAPINFQTEDDLTSVVLNKNNEVIISTANGKLIKFSY